MTPIIQIAELVLIGWLPGAAIFRLPWFNRDTRAALDPDERLFWAVIFSVAVSLSIVLALAVFHRYSFGRLLIADVDRYRARGSSGSRATAAQPTGTSPHLTDAHSRRARARRACGDFSRLPNTSSAARILAPTSNEGIQIAQRGALVLRDPVVATRACRSRATCSSPRTSARTTTAPLHGLFRRGPRHAERSSASFHTCFRLRLPSATASMA